MIKNEVEGLAWLYVSSARGNEEAEKAVYQEEGAFSTSVVLAARQRAAEIQNQIAGHAAPDVTSPPEAAIADEPRASGSGSFISADGFVLTAAHVVKDASRIAIVTKSGQFPATLVKLDATNDVALLKCQGSGFTPIPIASSTTVRVGGEVFTLGFPNIQIQGFDPKFTKGEISSETGIQDDPRDWQVSVPIQPGNSGGPLCDENGNLVGIVLATLDPLVMAKIAGEIPQNVNYAVKSGYILPLLDEVKNMPAPRPTQSGEKMEDVVDSVRPSTVLILIY